MASNDVLRRRLYESMDERDLTWFESTLSGLPQGRAPTNDYFRRLTETVLSLARQGRAVFLGRAADLLLPADRGFRVRIVAPLDQRVSNYALRLSLSPARAREEVGRIDGDRAAFVQHHFRRVAVDPVRHDLIINLGRWSVQQAADLILEAMRRRGILESRP
jgi:cytidylate kinase